MVDRLNPYEPPTATGDSPGDIAVGSKPRQPILAILAFNAAVLLILLSSVATMVTYVPSARASGLRFGLTCGVIGIGLIAASWHKLPRGWPDLRDVSSGASRTRGARLRPTPVGVG